MSSSSTYNNNTRISRIEKNDVNVKDIIFDPESDHSVEIFNWGVFIDGYNIKLLSLLFCQRFACWFKVPHREGRSKKKIGAYLRNQRRNDGTISFFDSPLPPSIQHGNDAAPRSGDEDSAVVHGEVQPQSKSLNRHDEPSVHSDDKNAFNGCCERGDSAIDFSCDDDDDYWAVSGGDTYDLVAGGDTEDSIDRMEEENGGGGGDSKHDAAPKSGDEGSAVAHDEVQPRSASLNSTGVIQFPGVGGEDCLYVSRLNITNDTHLDGSGGDNKSTMEEKDFGTGGDNGESKKEDSDAEFVNGGYADNHQSQQSDNVTTTPSWCPANSRLNTPQPILYHTEQGDPEDHNLMSSLFFVERAHQSLSDRLTESDVPVSIQPQFGDLHHFSYRGRTMEDFFEPRQSHDCKLFKLIQTEQVGPLRKQDSSNPKREHGYISFLHDSWFVDRIYYLLHEKDKDRGTFWDTVILQKKDDCIRLKAYRKASMQCATSPGLVRILNKMNTDEPEQCELGILLQVYADRYYIPAIVLEHEGPLLQKKRFGSSYNCRGQSKCTISKMPYIILLHDRVISNSGSIMKTVDLFLPAPDDAKKKNLGLVPGHARCYPIDSSQNYMPRYEYQRSKVESLSVLDSLIDHHLIDFPILNPLVILKTMRKGHDRFYKEKELYVSYQFERAILEAFLPFDGDSGTYTSRKQWIKFCADFLKKVQEAYHQGFQPFTTLGPRRPDCLQDPDLEVAIRYKLFVSSRLIQRRILLLALDIENRPTSIIFQEPSPSVNVEWPLLYVGRRNNMDEEGQRHPYDYYPGKICRLDLANTGSSSHQDPLPTPNFLQEDVSFAEIPDLHTGTGVTCNIDAISVIASDFDIFGKTFADKTSQWNKVCASSPCVKLRRFLRPQKSEASRLKINIYTNPTAKQDGRYSLIPDVESGLVKKSSVPLTNFPTHFWGQITVSSYEFHIGLTILAPEKSQEILTDFSHKALARRRICLPWSQKQLDALTEILNLADQNYDSRTEASHSTMNTEYNGKWEKQSKPKGAKTYIKLDGEGFSSLCRRFKEICIEIVDKKVNVMHTNTFLLAKKLLKRCILTAVTPGSKTQNWFANYYPKNGANGESQLGTTLHNTGLSVVSNIIPNVMSGVKFVFDLGYNVAEESHQHSIFVLNEDATKVVQENLSLNVEIARNCLPRSRGGIDNLLELWKEVGSHCSTDFLTCLVGMEVCVSPRGHAHGCLTEALQDCTVQVIFYETNIASNTFHTFSFEDISFAEVPATENKKECILFNLEERTTRKVFAHRMMADVRSRLPIIYIDPEKPGPGAYIFDPSMHVLCPCWPVSYPKRPLPVGGIHDLVSQMNAHPVVSGQQQNNDETFPTSLVNNEAIPFLRQNSQSNSVSLLGNDNSSSVTTSPAPAQQNMASPVHHGFSQSYITARLNGIYEQGSLLPFGIENPNVLCYIIAPIQMLISCAPILREILASEYTGASGDAPVGSVTQFKEILRTYAGAPPSAVSPGSLNLVNILQDPEFNSVFESGNQCCALEACEKLTGSLFEVVPALRRLFEYKTTTEYFCTRCNETVKVAPVCTTSSPISISLSVESSAVESSAVESSNTSTSCHCIEELLTRYFSGGQASLDTVVCQTCENHEGVIGKISLSGDFPAFVVIHLHRNNMRRKNHDEVCISPFATFDFGQSKKKYMLRSMVCHIGNSVEHGHYISYGYRQERAGQKWFKFDDRNVEGFGDCGEFLGHDLECQKTVVMLLYQSTASVAANSKSSESGKREDAGASNPSPCKSDRLNSRKVSETGKRPNGGDTNPYPSKRLCNNLDSQNGMKGGAAWNEGDDDSNLSWRSDDDSNDGSASTDDEIDRGGLMESYNETALSPEELFSAEFGNSPESKAKELKVNKWPQFGNKRTCGLGTGHFSLQATMKHSTDKSGELGVGIKGPPNGVGSMCVYSSQGKTADADLKRARAEAHELPFLLHTILSHADLDDHALLEFACRFVESVGTVETSHESMNASLQRPSSLRVEYNFMWDPKQAMPWNFIPLPTSEVAKAVFGTELQALFSRRLHIHIHPISILKGIMKNHLDSLSTECVVQSRRNLNAAGGVFEKCMGEIRETLSSTTPNITATYIQHGMMLMGLMGGKHGAYAPKGLKDILAFHPYEIKVATEACLPLSDLARSLGLHYEIHDAKLFPDHADPDSGISFASNALSEGLATYSAINKALKNEEFKNLIKVTGSGQPPMSQIHNLQTYMLHQHAIVRCWTSFLNKWEGATGSIIAHEDTSRSIPLARRLANLLLPAGGITDQFLESFGDTLQQILTFIIIAYYSDLADFIGLDGEIERNLFYDLAKAREVQGLQELVDAPQGRQCSQQQFSSNNMNPRNVLISQGNDHATDEVKSFHHKTHDAHYFGPGVNMNILPETMFGTTMGDKTTSVQGNWRHRFPAVKLFQSFNELIATARSYDAKGPNARLLEPSQLNRIFHKTFIEVGFKYIWYHPNNLLLRKKILLIDAFDATFPVEATLLDILSDAQLVTLDRIFFVLGTTLIDPVPTIMRDTVGTPKDKDDFSAFVGHLKNQNHPSILQDFLLSCDDNNLGLCTSESCNKSTKCKCSIWDKCIHDALKFSLLELKGGAEKTRKAFLHRASKNAEQRNLNTFNPTPNQQEERVIDDKLMQHSTFFQALTLGITGKVLMAWRALRIYYLHHRARKHPMDKNEAAKIIVQALSGQPPVEATLGTALAHRVAVGGSNFPTSPLIRRPGRIVNYSPQQSVGGGIPHISFQTPTPVAEHKALLPFQRLTPGKPH